MPEIHVRQPAAFGKLGFTYSACGPSIENKKRNKNLEKQEIQDIFIKTN